MKKQVIRVTGQAKDVFGAIKQLAEKSGKLTIGEIAKQRKGESV